MLRPLALIVFALPAWAADAVILDCSHESRVFKETRHYRIFLPPDYESSKKRYPVIYWFHGYTERYNKGPAGKEYDCGNDYKGDNIANFVSANDVIVVKLDGYNPRTPGEDYPRPYNIGPVETDRQFPLYFPELVSVIDGNYRTIANREHRAVSGLSMGGFMSYWIAGKYPDLVSNASSFMGSPEFFVGPKDFPVEYRHDDMSCNYAGVLTRLVTGTRDFIRFYHQQLNQFWTLPTHQTEEFDSDHGVPELSKTFDFHMKAFDAPLPKPELWSHVDVYPSFSVWDWTVTTDRKNPGFTSIENVSPTGFQTSVREWLPSGRILRNVHVSVTTQPLYRKNARVPITIIRLRDNHIGREHIFADMEGRLHIDLEGDEYQVEIGYGLVKRSISAFSVPSAPATTNFQIADHRSMPVFQHAVEKQTVTLGEGNGDGKVNPGEQIAVLFPDAPDSGAFRAAELFGEDDCVELTNRVSDNWADYDWVGASAKYTLAKIVPSCPAGHIIKLRARVVIPNRPNHKVHDSTIELEVSPPAH